jgi:hypothetical protein
LKQGDSLSMRYNQGKMCFKLGSHKSFTDVTSLEERREARSLVPCIWVYAQAGNATNYGQSTVKVTWTGRMSKGPNMAMRPTFSKDMSFTDCTIVCGTEELKAHRVVLCAASPVFNAAFNGGLREAAEQRYVIQDCNQARVAEALIKFMYDEVLPDVDVPDLITLLPLADYFERDELWATIVGKLIDTATEDTVGDIAQVLSPLCDDPIKSWAYFEFLALLRSNDSMLDSSVRALVSGLRAPCTGKQTSHSP